MEIKKTEEADLENKRGTRLLMALIVSLALLFVAFEYTSFGDSSVFERTEPVEEWSEDLQNVSIEEDMVVMVPIKTPQVAEQLKVVDEVMAEEQQAEDLDTLVAAAGPFASESDAADIVDIVPPESADDSQPVFRVVEELPQFPGGMAEYIRWLTKNLRYPYLAQKNKVEGKVVAQFIVNTDGTISDIRIVQSLDAYCDREALRVLRLMPKWKAGVHDGSPCRTQVRLPIVFRQ